VRRTVFAVVAVLVAVVLQTALLDRLPFPGGSAPDLVLVLVVTLALASGPMEGVVIGFGAGLALDVAPPASNLLGLSALVFCLVGYGCGRLRGPLERSSWLPLAVVALGVAAGEALYALVGMIFGDPDITWQSVRLVLPVSVAYDLLLCPFVVYAVVRFGGYGGWATVGARPADLAAGRDLAGAGGVLNGVAAAGAVATGAAVRDTRSGRDPRLRAAAGRGADGWIGGHQSGPGPRSGAWVHRRRPLQLRARGGVAGSAAGLGSRPGPPAPGRPVHLRLGTRRRGDGVLGGSVRSLLGGGPDGPLGGSGRQSRMRGAAFRGSIGLVSVGSTAGGSRPGSARLSARAFRGSGGPAKTMGDGSSRGPLTRPRRRSGAFRGGPSALTAAGTGLRRAAPLRLRARRRDGVVGGGVLGGRAPGGGGLGGGRTMSGSAFVARRAPGSPGALRSGRGHGAVPRFRSSGSGLSGWWKRVLPGRRDRVIGSVPSGSGRGARRGFTVSGRRRFAGWGRGSKRTGGLP
jgi:rod shape-determining protein MreD